MNYQQQFRASTIQWLDLCIHLCTHGAPLTPEESSRYDTQRASEMARAEARMAALSPQLNLRGVA